jgi:hypothetical protein
MDTEGLQALRTKLKTGDYDGADIMRAWLAIDELLAMRSGLHDLLSWFPGAPTEPEWRLRGGDLGADAAVAHARELLARNA